MTLRDFNNTQFPDDPTALHHGPVGNDSGLENFHTIQPEDIEPNNTPKIVGAGKDRICVTPEAEKFARRTPHADYVEIAEAGHEILMERNAIRAKFWLAFDAFMNKHRAPV